MTPTSLTHTEVWSLLALFAASFAVLAQTLHGDGAPLIASLALSGLAFATSYALIRWLGEVFMRAGLKGRDMSKVRKVEIPETMGAVCAVVYLLAIIIFIPFPFYKDIVAATSGGGNRDFVLEVQQVETGRFLHRFPHSKLASYLSAILSLQVIVILGIGDDLFDIRWRHKVLIPAFASIPMLIVYFVDFGVTHVVIPTPLKPYFGELFDLGWLYYAYMSAICIFCPNSINILAGINGIEVAQSLIIGLSILANDSLYILPLFKNSQTSTTAEQPPFSTPRSPNHPATDSHLLSVYLLLPFLAVSTALLLHNKYPARVFVGDTYCYFAGMVFAVVAILGHFSKTLLLLFLPQLFNFAYSAPQLFALVPCPRHRLPHFNARTGLLEPSFVDFTPPAVDASETPGAKASNGNALAAAPPGVSVSTDSIPKHRRAGPRPRPPHALVQRALKLLHALRLCRVETDAATGQVARATNLTLLNLWLVWFGPMREPALAGGLCALQVVCAVGGLWVRHRLALWVFRVDNTGWWWGV